MADTTWTHVDGCGCSRCVDASTLPEQPAREADEGWYQLPDENGNFDFYTDSGKRVGRATSMGFLQTIIDNHRAARLVPGLVEALRNESLPRPDGHCWCDDDYRQNGPHAEHCQGVRLLVDAARKAGVE